MGNTTIKGIMLLFALLMVSWMVKSQEKLSREMIAATWKPVYAGINKAILVDINAHKVTLMDTLDEIIKNDKDPEESRKMFSFLANMMLDKMGTLLEVYSADSIYTEINTRTGKERKGIFFLDVQSGILTRKIGPRIEHFTVYLEDGKLILQGQLGSDSHSAGKLEVVYERKP